jgi:2-polyprenyl-3-methyl-5-hydroxy-6-metoxy-1,4-benzoquinol methylase
MTENSSPDFPEEINEQTKEIWNRLAGWWDDKIGDGNEFQTLLIEPSTERLLSLQSGERVLDIACGAGRFARRIAELGTMVIAFDHAEAFIQRARQRTVKNTDKISYQVIDATNTGELKSLGKSNFDAAVCTMGLMDMSAIEPLLSTMPYLLKPGGRFVFSVMHPAFNSGMAALIAEEENRDGELKTTFGVKITGYSKPFTYKGIGIPGQPEMQHYFHRPINLLFNTFFKHGFVLDGMEEPTLPAGLEAQSKSSLNWKSINNIPPILVARMRLLPVH